MGCTNHVHGGACRGDVFHACGQVELRGVIEYEFEGAGGDVAGGAGAVVLHAAGEGAAVEDRAYVEVAVGDFFTAAVLGGVDHGEGGDASRRLGRLGVLLAVLRALGILRIFGVFSGNLGGDALLVQAAGQAGGEDTAAAVVAGCGDVLGVGTLHAGPLHAAGVATLVFALVRAVIGGIVGAADSGNTGSTLGCLFTIRRRLRAVRVGHLRGVLTVHGCVHAANTGGCVRLGRGAGLST